MYTIHDFGDMIADRGRTEAYARALRACVTPDSVVLDLGAGAGIMTLIACQAGARRVFAIESAGIIDTAMELVRANGYSDRVELIQAVSTAVSLPQPVDVVVAEIHGVLPFFCGCPTSIFDARDRFLKPGGVVIPMTETVKVAVVSAASAYENIVRPWEMSPGLDGQPARRRAVSEWGRRRFSSKSLVVDPATWVVIDYAHGEGSNPRGAVGWTVAQPCEAHGLCLWFDCETAPGIGFSNSPASGEAHVFGHAFFPWTDACRLEAGDHVGVEIRADLVGEDYLWGWKTTIRTAGATGPIKARFDQSQFASVPFSQDWLRKSASSFIPSPNEEAAIDKMILDLLVDRTRLEDIARRVSERFPDRFPDWRHALTRVGRLSMQYSD